MFCTAEFTKLLSRLGWHIMQECMIHSIFQIVNFVRLQSGGCMALSILRHVLNGMEQLTPKTLYHMPIFRS